MNTLEHKFAATKRSIQLGFCKNENISVKIYSESDATKVVPN